MIHVVFQHIVFGQIMQICILHANNVINSGSSDRNWHDKRPRRYYTSSFYRFTSAESSILNFFQHRVEENQGS